MLDTTLPLQIAQATQPQNPLEQYGKALALKNALGQQQLQQQALQTGGLENQQRQIALDQTKALNSAYQGSLTQNPDGTVDIDPGKLTQALSASGHGSAIPSVLKGVQDYQKSNADLLKAKNEVAQQQKDNGGDIGATVKAGNYDPNLFLTLATHAAASKSVDPAIVTPIIQKVQQALAQDPTGAAAKQLVQNISDQLISGSDKQRTLAATEATAQSRKTTADTGAQKQTNEAPGQLADSAQKARNNLSAQLGAATSQAEYQQILGKAPFEVAREFDGKTPDQARRMGMSSEQQNQADLATVKEKREAAQQNIANGLASGRLNIAQADLELKKQDLDIKKQQFGFDTNGGISPTAQMIYDGRMDPQTVRAIVRRNPGVIDQLNRIDPAHPFDEATIDNRYNAIKDFTSSTQASAAGQMKSLNTLIHHADLYQQVGTALKNGSFVPGNAVYNAVSSMMGSPAPQNANLVGRFLAGETGKVATGGVPAEGEINGILKGLSTSSSPDQIAQAGKTLLQVASGRAIPLLERAKQANIQNVVPLIGDDAKGILQKNGFDPNTMKPVAQGGTGGSWNPPQGAKVQHNPTTGKERYSTDGGKTWVVQP
jgi:hypothetical protein